jgi:hypothetical protein
MSTTTERLTKVDADRLRMRDTRLREEMGALALVGMEDSPRAQELRAEREAIAAKLREHREQQNAAQREQWAAEDARREAAEAGQRRAEQEAAAAVEWLTRKLAGAPVLKAELEREAAGAGIGTVALLTAARELDVSEAYRYGSGGRVRNGDPVYWGAGFMGAGYSVAGKV